MQSQVLLDEELDFQELLRKSKRVIDKIKSKAPNSGVGFNWQSPSSVVSPIISQVSSVNVVNRPALSPDSLISWHLDVTGLKRSPPPHLSSAQQISKLHGRAEQVFTNMTIKRASPRGYAKVSKS